MRQGKGSVRFEAKEWKAGGAIHFYGSRKPRTFIIEVTITTEVRGELLQQAVEKTLQRMPYYASTLPRILPMTGIIGDELGIPCEKLPFASFLNPEVELPPEQR